ncbi:L-aspartate oxidase [Aeromicrobium sp. Root344]|uniref:oxygenase MpaB family protein n=1 Tax=Aeromicrobium sp. Root344 TaxID=1736521 RepID=UPI0006F731C3|nr:oxygenase MpaB family protein [Aeromicrobium sp. Root344]KQV75881.1 L-aspartate oxidase [Aeromicrobium sp. Root344]
MRRDHWQRRIAELDPETQYEEIARIGLHHEFPWDYQQALSFALFRTYAVPSIGRLLFDTGEFTERTQKRHDDTALVLEAVLVDGMESPDGRAAVRRMNQMHGSYDISNDDLRYVLATFVVVPHRWLQDYGWRKPSDREVTAGVRYYQRLGALMGIKDIPHDLAGFEELMDSYETEHFTPDPKTRAVADATLELLVSFYPRIAAKPVEVFSRALMDDALLEAFGYEKPSRLVVAMARGGLRLRARIERFMPPRRTPQYARDLKRIKTYPGGFMVERLGTFPSTMPEMDDVA